MPFDITTAIPISKKNNPSAGEKSLLERPEFDISTAKPTAFDNDGMTAYDHFIAGKLDDQIKDAIHRPIDGNQVKYIQEQEKDTVGAFNSFMIPYTEGIVGFFTKPFGYRPDLSNPFGLVKGPKGESETQRDQQMQKDHPIATTLGQIVSGIAPFIATAPLFPHGLLGTLASFETVGLTSKVGEIQTDESLMSPLGQKGAELGVEAIKSGAMAPIWHYSGALKFIGRPFLSAVTRAGARGAGQATLSAVFGTDLAQALKDGGKLTALSLIFETPTLAKTALGRGVISNLNAEAARRGLGEGKLTIDVDKLDAASTRASILDMVKAFYKTMEGHFKKAKFSAENPTPQARFFAPPATPQSQGEANASSVTLVPPERWQPFAGGRFHAPENAPMFYSKMMAVLAEKMPESAPIAQIKGILQSSGISNEEIEWSGAEDFLKGKDKVNKVDFLSHLKNNQTAIEEIVKGGINQPIPEFLEMKTEEGLWEYTTNIGKQDVLIQETPQHQFLAFPDKEAIKDNGGKLFNTFADAKRWIQETNQPVLKEKQTKFSQYTLPGGENYREVLLTDPNFKDGNQSYSVKQISPREFIVEDNLGYEHGFVYDNKEETRISADFRNKEDPGFRSSHWDERNVLSHARLTDRMTIDGKKVLFVEEVQSDWARELRKHGDAPRSTFNEYAKSKGLTEKEAEEDFHNGGKIYQAWKKIPIGTPSHPLLKHWQPLILKRLLRMAAEGDYDYLAWTTGEQQAARYDLSKQAKKITASHSSKGVVYLQIEDINGNKVSLPSPHIAKDRLPEVIGKDLAEKISKEVGTRKDQKNKKEYSAGDLKVGGDWANNLYDQQIPNWLNDYVKKFGSNVEIIKIKVGSEHLKDLIVDENSDGTFSVVDDNAGGRVVDQGFDTEAEAEAALQKIFESDRTQEDHLQQAVPITQPLKQELVYAGQPILGKMPADIGKPNLPSQTGKFIFRMAESVDVINTKGEKVTLPKGEEYRTVDVVDHNGNIVPGKVRLQDGKQITVFEGELNKLKGHLLPKGEQPFAGGKTHFSDPQKNLDSYISEIEKIGDQKLTTDEIFSKYDNDLKPIAKIEKAYADSLGVKDSNVYCSEAHFVDHHINHHPKTTIEEYRTLPDVLMDPDDVKVNERESGYVFIKKYDQYHIAITNVDISDEKIILHKTFFTQTRKPYMKFPSVELEAGEAAHPPSTKPEINQAPAASEISALPANKNISSEKDNVKPNLTDEELSAAWGEEMSAETERIKDELREFLSGKLKPELKEKGEYADLKHLSWLWAKPGERGYTPDELTELSVMGFSLGDPTESGFDTRVIELIESYFNEDIQRKAVNAVVMAERHAKSESIKIGEAMMKKHHRELARVLHIRAIEAAKIVAKVEKILSKPLARSKVKQVIRANTGMIKMSDIIGEDEALARLMQREQAVSKEAFRAGREVGREELKARQAEIKKRKEDKEAASEEIKGMINDLRDIKEHLGVLPVDYQDTVKEILDEYDIPEKGFKRSTKTLAARDARRKYVEIMKEEGEEVNIPEEDLDLLEKITPNEMTVEDLRRVHLTLKRLYYQGKIKNKLLTALTAQNFEEIKNEGVNVISNGEGLNEESNVVKIFKEQNKSLGSKTWEGLKNFVNEHLRPEVMIHGLDGWDKKINTKVIWDPLFQAFLKEELDSDESLKKIHNILEPLDMKNAYKKQEIGKFDGMTKASAYFIYANSLNEHNYQALLNTGISGTDIADVEKFLRMEEKQAIQNLLHYYSDVQYEALDKIHVLLNGVHMSKEEYYFPLTNLESKDGLLKDIEDQILKRFRFKVAGVSSGFTKGRVTHKSGFRQLDFFGVVIKNWEQVEHYKAFAPVIRDVRKYLGNLEIKKAVENKFGSNYYAILQKFLKDVAYGGDQALLTERDRWVQSLRTNFMKAVLSFNLLSPVRQFLGFLPAMHFVGKAPVIKATFRYSADPMKWWKFADSKSPLLKFRAFHSEREMRELIARRDPGYRLQKMTGSSGITEAGMLPLIYTDKVICQIIWIAAYDSTLEKGGSEESAVAFGDETVRRTQNMGDIIFLADAFRGNMWEKVFTTFKNENNQNFNLNYENIMKSKEGQQSWLHFVDGVIFLFILPAILYGWTQRKRIQNSRDEILNDMAGQALGGLMYLGDLISAGGRKFGSGGGINPVENIFSSTSKVFTSKKPVAKIDNVLKTASYFYGLPYVGAKRLLTGQPLGQKWDKKKKNKLSRKRSLKTKNLRRSRVNDD